MQLINGYYLVKRKVRIHDKIDIVLITLISMKNYKISVLFFWKTIQY